MKKNTILPLLLLVTLIVGTIIYQEKKRCVADAFKNCKVNETDFGYIKVGFPYEDVIKILGRGNMSSPNQNSTVHEDCKKCDSIILWDSDKYYQPDFESIFIGFIKDTVVYKLYVRGEKMKSTAHK